MTRPSFDPWLAHLRRDRRGLPVPYINRWGPEAEDRTYTAYDPHVRARAAFIDDSQEPEPDFTRQHMGRQRECVTAGLCQVCARPVPWSRRNLVIAALSVEWITYNGRELPVVIEPWLDDRCADIALSWCPALIRRRDDEKLTLVKITSQRDVLTFVSKGWVEGALEEETRAAPVALWAKIALLSHRISCQ